MPLHGTRLELDVSDYFDSFFHKVINKNIPKLSVIELEKLIAKKKDTLKFIDSIYEETFNAKYDDFNDYIIESISKYDFKNDELAIYEKSEYFVFETGGYYVETKEGNQRNWIYCFEIDTAYNTLKNKIKNLERKLQKLQKP
jgi:hypothetical protein